MEQRNREFAPHVLAVPVGSTVTFPNYDSIYHNVFSRSMAKMFDLGLYKKGEARQVTFDKPGIVHISCNLHANMSAYIVVVAAPHYAITGDDGAFAFKSLRPGKYTLKAWSEKSKLPVTRTVVVKRGANKVDVGVAADAPDRAPARQVRRAPSGGPWEELVARWPSSSAPAPPPGCGWPRPASPRPARATPTASPPPTQIADALRGDGKGAHERAVTLAQLPRLQAAVATDAATVRDLTTEELMFRPQPSETIELGQIVGGKARSLLRLPEGSKVAAPLASPGVHLQIAGGALILSDVEQGHPEPGRRRADGRAGGVAHDRHRRARGQARRPRRRRRLAVGGGVIALGKGVAKGAATASFPSTARPTARP